MPQLKDEMADNKLIEHQKVDELFKTIRTLIKTSGWAFAAFCGWKAIESLAGLNTNVVLSLLADLKFSLTIALAGSAAAWAVVERILRQRKVVEMQNRIIILEKRVDPNRSTSGLSKKGRTNLSDIER